MFRKYPPFLMTLAPETPGGSGDQGGESPEVEQIPSTTTEDSGDGVDVDDGEDNVEWTRNVHSALPRASGENLIVRVARNR